MYVAFALRALYQRSLDLGYAWVERKLEEAFTRIFVGMLAPAPPDGPSRVPPISAATFAARDVAQSMGLPPPSVVVQAGPEGVRFLIPGGPVGEPLRSTASAAAAGSLGAALGTAATPSVTVTDALGAALGTAAATRSGVVAASVDAATSSATPTEAVGAVLRTATVAGSGVVAASVDAATDGVMYLG